MNFILILRTVFIVTARPVVTGSRLVRNTLSRLKYILKFAIQNLVVYDTSFHVYYYRSRLEIYYLGART